MFHFRWLDIKGFEAALPISIMLFQPSEKKLVSVALEQVDADWWIPEPLFISR